MPNYTAAASRRASNDNYYKGPFAGGAFGNSGGGVSKPPKYIAKPPAKSSKGNVYTVKRGDNLSSIAKRYGTDLNTILKNNPRLRKNPNVIFRGTKVRIK